METPLVSIIIPTFNRAHLIGETLDSIMAQTYTNWECIIVDDGSTDNTSEIVGGYVEKDPRFQYHHRPKDRLPGGNAARNYGFEVSKGEYVNWFDSDDIMLPDFLQKKIDLIQKGNYDFVISNSINFNDNNIETEIFEHNNIGLKITAEHYIKGEINWITNDVMLLSRTLKDIRFNEKLHSGQEYNFFSRYLLTSTNGAIINDCLSKRRVHRGSIQVKLNANLLKKKREILFNEMILLNDIKNEVSVVIINRSLQRIIRFSYEVQEKFSVNKIQWSVLKIVMSFGNYKICWYYIFWIISNLIIGKGYYFIRRCKFNTY